jgi:hypothetical protein
VLPISLLLLIDGIGSENPATSGRMVKVVAIFCPFFGFNSYQ